MSEVKSIHICLIDGGNDEYECTIGWTVGRIHPMITADYLVLPEADQEPHRFGARGPQALIFLLVEKDFPVPTILLEWSQQQEKVLKQLFGDDYIAYKKRDDFKALTDGQIQNTIETNMREVFWEAQNYLMRYIRDGIKAADEYDDRFDELSLQI